MIFRFHFVSIITALLILILGVIPAHFFPKQDIIGAVAMDKVAHFLLYFILAITTLVGFKKHYYYGGFNLHPVLSALVCLILYGFLVELIQTFLDTRSFEWMDIMANNAGVLLGLITFRLIYGKRLFYN